jgi:hypothetical protein
MHACTIDVQQNVHVTSQIDVCLRTEAMCGLVSGYVKENKVVKV